MKSEDRSIEIAGDRGENPMFINSEKFWWGYRFGGWVTMLADHNCNYLENLYGKNGMM